MSLATGLEMFFLAQYQGIKMWVEPPYRYNKNNLRVTDVREDENGRLFIDMRFSDNRVDRKHFSDSCTICILIGEKKIDYKETSNWLLEKCRLHHGTALGVGIVSFPIALVLSPILISANKTYKMLEEKRGISRHHYNVFNAIKDQLDEEVRSLLLEAMKNDWNHKNYMSQKLSFEEAKDFLGSCYCIETRGLYYYGNAGDRVEYKWLNAEGELVAVVNFVKEELHGKMKVLGSFFKEKEEVQELIERYKVKAIRDYNDMGNAVLVKTKLGDRELNIR